MQDNNNDAANAADISNALDELTEAFGINGPVTADERARYEIQRERAAAAAPAETPSPDDGLVGIDAEIDEDALIQANLRSVLAQSIDGRNLTERQIAYSRVMGAAALKENPAVAQEWDEWAMGSANRTGFLISRLADGAALPKQGPAAYQAELADLEDRWAAQAELDQLYIDHPVGSASYASPQVQRRVQALFQFISGSEPLVGRSNRRV